MSREQSYDSPCVLFPQRNILETRGSLSSLGEGAADTLRRIGFCTRIVEPQSHHLRKIWDRVGLSPTAPPLTQSFS